MPDHRISGPGGQRLDYTCANRRFRTNLTKGHPHGGTQAGGSVFPGPLVQHGSYSLWLEHVEEIGTGDDYYWFMWYDAGQPTIPLSGVMTKPEIAELVKQIADFVP